MKRNLIVLLAFLLTLPGFAQELNKKEQRQLQKELKKEQQAEEMALKAQMVGLMVEYQRFVLEADRLKDKRGTTVNVSSTLNFIAVDSLAGVLQVGSNAYVGMNGVGGITIEGQVSNYEYSFNEKNGTYNVSYYIRSASGSYDVRMVVYSDTRADATVSSTWPGKLNYSGYLVAPAASRVYKGTSRY
jgi:hypothetical protein